MSFDIKLGIPIPSKVCNMLFVVIFQDKPSRGELRAAHLQAHLEWLERHSDAVPIAGSLRQDPGEAPQGGLWVAEAESKLQIEELLKSDPFFRAGLRQSYEILHWSKANSERKVLI